MHDSFNKVAFGLLMIMSMMTEWLNSIPHWVSLDLTSSAAVIKGIPTSLKYAWSFCFLVHRITQYWCYTNSVSTVGVATKMDDKILGNKARMPSRIREHLELNRGFLQVR